MKKLNLFRSILLTTLLQQTCFSQSNDSTSFVINKDNLILIECAKIEKYFFSPTSGEKLEILTDECFDYHYSFLWNSLHEPISVRRLLLSRLKKDVLSKLLVEANKYDYKLCEFCNGSFKPDVPYCDKSITYLIIEALNN